MYTEIEELIEAICHEQTYLTYSKAKEKLENDEKTLALLSRHQIAQENYLRVKKYGQADDLKKELQEIKKDMMENQIIQDYYQAYYQMNDLLEDVAKIVFQNISDEIQIETLKL